MFAREGYPFILGAAAIAAIAFVMAVRVRSWPLWLVALLLTVIALSVAWFFRSPAHVGARGTTVAVTRANGGNPVNRVVQYVQRSSGQRLLAPDATLRFALRERTAAGETMIAVLPPT